MSVKSKSDILPGSVNCIFCNKNINFLNEGKQKFFNHLRDEHMIFLNHDVVLAVNFLDKDTLQVIVKQFESSYFRIIDNENKKDNQIKQGKAIAKKVEKKVGIAKKVENDKNNKNSKKVKNVPKVETNKNVQNGKDVKVSKNNRKFNRPGKIKVIDTNLLQEPPVQTQTTILIEDDEQLKGKTTFIVEDDEPLKIKSAKPNTKKTNSNKWSLKTHLKSVDKRKSISTIKSKKVLKDTDVKPPKQVQKQSFRESKLVKRLNGSVGSKAPAQGLSIVKTLAKNNNKGGDNTNVLTGLAGITVTKAVQPKPSKVINLSTDNMAQIKAIAKNSNLGTASGFSCGVCSKKFNTEERYKKHTTICVKSILMG